MDLTKKLLTLNALSDMKNKLVLRIYFIKHQKLQVKIQHAVVQRRLMEQQLLPWMLLQRKICKLLLIALEF